MVSNYTIKDCGLNVVFAHENRKLKGTWQSQFRPKRTWLTNSVDDFGKVPRCSTEPAGAFGIGGLLGGRRMWPFVAKAWCGFAMPLIGKLYGKLRLQRKFVAGTVPFFSSWIHKNPTASFGIPWLPWNIKAWTAGNCGRDAPGGLKLTIPFQYHSSHGSC